MTSQNWIDTFKNEHQPFVIAGPCSAESPEQLLAVAVALKSMGITIMRAGVWKPRTRPHTFEGFGTDAFAWLRDVSKATGIQFAIEVGNPHHVELACEAGIELMWIGARTTVNPFSVQEIANALKGVDKIVCVKNPINPDLSLWIGALERVAHAGIKKLGAIHRGFSSFQNARFRNQPLWQIPLELKTLFPSIALIADPSHIAGNRSLIFEVSQKALDLDYDGLMIEVHPDPNQALSDAQQQITPDTLKAILGQLRILDRSSSNSLFLSQLEKLREKIDNIDQELIDLLATRSRLIEQIGDYKKENQVTVFQLERWNEIMKTRPEWARLASINPEYVRELYKIIHDESIRVQTDIMNKKDLEI